MEGKLHYVDPRKVILSGDSFGGHIAVYISLNWIKRGYDDLYHPIFFQVHIQNFSIHLPVIIINLPKLLKFYQD